MAVWQIDPDTRRMLHQETEVHLTQIRTLYRKLDRQFSLRGADLPIEIDFSTDSLGAYLIGGQGEEEGFRFSLLFIGYAVKKPLDRADRLDLYKHEYAHYMQYNMPIPKKYTFSPGIHGSAWKYCCSLIGAAPTPFYRAGEGLMKHDYDQVLTSRIQDTTVPLRDTYRREQEYRNSRDRVIKYRIGETVLHPKFGEGIVEAAEQLTGSVRLTVHFRDRIRKIDQKWLVKQEYSTAEGRTDYTADR